ncbi:MAG: imidazole glycerol phosphate synthase subunit HisH [Burkholderiaceae bacterium]
MIAIVDYGAGNIRSVERAVHAACLAVGHSPDRVRFVSQPDELRSAERVLFPGQGAMHDCMASLKSSGLEAALREAMQTKPFFGICVGQQMLFDRSEEGDTPGLGIFSGQVVKFTAARGVVDQQGQPLKVPHMGWNQVQFTRPHPITQGLEDKTQGHWFYFVHSFHAEPSDGSDVLGQSDYGIRFTCAVARDNIVATQFHPEKSAGSGLKLLENFLTWNP